MRAHGAIEVADIVELADTLAAFQTVQRPAGRRLAVITSSGGLAELILGKSGANWPSVTSISPKRAIEGRIA